MLLPIEVLRTGIFVNLGIFDTTLLTLTESGILNCFTPYPIELFSVDFCRVSYFFGKGEGNLLLLEPET